MDLQPLQIAGKHTTLSIVQGRQIFRTRLSEDTSGEVDEITAHVHRTDGSIAVEVEFFYGQMIPSRDIPMPGRIDW